MKRERYTWHLGLIDWLFNFALSFVLLFAIMLLIARVETATKSVEDKNEFIVTVTWNDGTDHDVDLWMQDPSQATIGYFRKDANGMFLQRDDTGRANKKVILPDGTVKEEKANREIANVRSFLPGQYNVNLHLYRVDATTQDPIKVEVKLIKVNPYQEFPPVTVTFTPSDYGNEKTALNFILNERGEVTTVTQAPIEFVLRSTSQYNVTGENR